MDQCLLHAGKSTKVSVIGENVLFRLRLAYERDEAVLQKLVPGCQVCASCCARVTRQLAQTYGKNSWKAKVNARRNEYLDRQRSEQKKRVRVEEEPSFAASVFQAPSFAMVSTFRIAQEEDVFTVLPSDSLAALFRAPIAAELNSLFFALGFPDEMVGRDGALPLSPVWKGLAALQPSLPMQLRSLVEAEEMPRLSTIKALFRCIPRYSNALSLMAGVSCLRNCLPLVVELLALFHSCPKPFGLYVDVKRLLTKVASATSTVWDGKSLAAALWTREFDAPTLLPLTGMEANLHLDNLKQEIAQRLFMPENMLTVLNFSKQGFLLHVLLDCSVVG